MKLSKIVVGYYAVLIVPCSSFQNLPALISYSCVRQVKSNSRYLLLSNNQKEEDGNIPEENDDDDDDDDDDKSKIMDDWRDVRAKLVMQYRKKEDNEDEEEDVVMGSISTEKNEMKNSTTTTTTQKGGTTLSSTTTQSTISQSNCWAYDSRDVIETGSLIVSHPSQDFTCSGLRQQYFYKCVVLVVEHSSQCTKGIILNRPTDQTMKDCQQKEELWKLSFGGDVEGIGSGKEESSLACLYRRNESSQVPKGMMINILKDISIVPWEIAQYLVEQEKATQEDFRLYCGYAKWGPGQLQNELERGDWLTVATDAGSIWEIIGKESSNSAGTDKWVQIINRIGKQSLISATNQKFQTDMLEQYVRLRLLKESQKQTRNTHASNLAPGTLVRASAPILLDEQVFHQSLVLILQNDEKMIAGLILNRPYSTSVKIAGTRLPVRYGGRFGLDVNDMPEFYLYYNHQKLQEAKVGEPISEKHKQSNFWKCTKEDANTAVEVGLAKSEDFLVVLGLSVWDKEKISSKYGEPSSMELDSYFSEVDEGSIGTIWKLLKVQEPLNKKNAAENLEAANTAWMLSGDAGWMLSSSKQLDRHSSDMETKEQQKVQSLAYSALDKWIRLFLLKP
jgi:putative transcriptional regulator